MSKFNLKALHLSPTYKDALFIIIAQGSISLLVCNVDLTPFYSYLCN